jgi:sulfide:quinone oxidoreductase
VTGVQTCALPILTSLQATSGVVVNTRVIFCSAQAKLYPVKAYNATVERVVARRGIELRLLHNLIEVHPEQQVAVFEVRTEGAEPSLEEIPFDLLHVVPPMAAPDVVAHSPLAIEGPGGWVEVNKDTCQHKRFADVFALGDVSSLPTSKSLAAIRGQAPGWWPTCWLSWMDGPFWPTTTAIPPVR